MSFPDKKYLKSLLVTDQKRFDSYSAEDKLLAFSGVFLNSVADFLLDDNIKWKKEKLKIDDLTLTGTNPTFNKIVLGKAKSSPAKLRELLGKKEIRKIFGPLTVSTRPILVIYYNGEYRTFDGMHRVISALTKNKTYINAYVGRFKARPKPKCEPHLIYDLIRPYKRGLSKDRKGLITSLKYLKKTYSNVEALLKERFNSKYLKSREIQEIIKEVLKK